jgi:hypothetical protein
MWGPRQCTGWVTADYINIFSTAKFGRSAKTIDTESETPARSRCSREVANFTGVWGLEGRQIRTAEAYWDSSIAAARTSGARYICRTSRKNRTCIIQTSLYMTSKRDPWSIKCLTPLFDQRILHIFFTRLKHMTAICTASFNIKELDTSPTECIHIFYMILMIHSQYFPKQHYSIGLCNGSAVFLWGMD